MSDTTPSTPAKTTTKSATLTVRLDRDLLAAFKAICEREQYSQTLVIRELVKGYVKKNGQGDLFK